MRHIHILKYQISMQETALYIWIGNELQCAIKWKEGAEQCEQCHTCDLEKKNPKLCAWVLSIQQHGSVRAQETPTAAAGGEADGWGARE